MKSKSQSILNKLSVYESQNITFQDPENGWPIVWDKALGTRVWDVDGREYLDLTAAFGVAAAGHAHPEITRAATSQIQALPHAMGDVHPHASKAELLEAISKLTFERWFKWADQPVQKAKSILGNSGFEAVEAALKTAILATGKPDIISFQGGYHGLGYGALNATSRDYFVAPFRGQIKRIGTAVSYPIKPNDLGVTLDQMNEAAKKRRIGAVLVEPIQARGGIRVPTSGFLSELRKWCTENGCLLVLDEIYTGLGRTGNWFACEVERVIPDLICLGKALTGGYPLSACVGSTDWMDRAWPGSEGEALHTSTFLGNPVGCAMALAQIKLLKRLNIPRRAENSGRYLLNKLEELAERLPKGRVQSRGMGLMAGMEIRDKAGRPDGITCIKAVKTLLKKGFIFLPEGDLGEVLAWTPPLTITRPEIDRSVDAAGETLQECFKSETV